MEKLKMLLKESSITEAEWKKLPPKSRIPYSHEEGHLKVNAKINGRDVKMIFDTGASICSLSTADYPDLISRATLSRAQPVPIRRPHGFTEGRLCQVDLTEHDITRRVNILATSEPGVTLVGQNFFKEYSYMIDPFYIRLTKAPYRPPEEKVAIISKDPNKIEKSVLKVESKASNPQDRWKLPFQRMAELMIVDM
ncbi:MAG TPA: retropepsin-like aspartic protease, partial [Candidatus Melainabacteria bacterium]|nr:retropepsin-like aspartic protease [Candidatus Melainabacteria bacterium]